VENIGPTLNVAPVDDGFVDFECLQRRTPHARPSAKRAASGTSAASRAR
jgi:hypothetical protein